MKPEKGKMKTNNKKSDFVFLWLLLAWFLLPAAAAPFASNSEGDEKRGVQLYQSGDFYSSAILFKNILARNPGNPVASFYTAKMSEDGDSVFFLLQKAIASPGLDTASVQEALYRIGQYYETKSEYEKASESYRKIISGEQQTSWILPALRGIAESKKMNRNFVEAQTAYKRLLDAGDTVFAYSGLGDCAFWQMDLEMALEYFKKVEMFPDKRENSRLYIRMILCYRIQGDSANLNLYIHKLKTEFPNSLDILELSAIEKKNGPDAGQKPEEPSLGKAAHVQNKMDSLSSDSLAPNIPVTIEVADKIVTDKENVKIRTEGGRKKPNSKPDTLSFKKKPASRDSSFWVQVGAFSSVDNAKRLKIEIEKTITLQAPLKIILDGQELLKKVRIGPFATEEKANTWAKLKKKELSDKARVIRIFE
jgi:tetratricopeptide (TPR) repeat protein